jgi:hypothetical protein
LCLTTKNKQKGPRVAINSPRKLRFFLSGALLNAEEEEKVNAYREMEEDTPLEPLERIRGIINVPEGYHFLKFEDIEDGNDGASTGDKDNQESSDDGEERSEVSSVLAEIANRQTKSQKEARLVGTGATEKQEIKKAVEPKGYIYEEEPDSGHNNLDLVDIGDAEYVSDNTKIVREDAKSWKKVKEADVKSRASKTKPESQQNQATKSPVDSIDSDEEPDESPNKYSDHSENGNEVEIRQKIKRLMRSRECFKSVSRNI